MSASMRPTRCPARASATATLADTVDLPTPPLPDEIARTLPRCGNSTGVGGGGTPGEVVHLRSEEHTSELQSLRHLVCRLLLEKKKHDVRRHDCGAGRRRRPLDP